MYFLNHLHELRVRLFRAVGPSEGDSVAERLRNAQKALELLAVITEEVKTLVKSLEEWAISCAERAAQAHAQRMPTIAARTNTAAPLRRLCHFCLASRPVGDFDDALQLGAKDDICVRCFISRRDAAV